MISTRWYNEGYDAGRRFIRHEADYDELAAIARTGGIPAGWDIFRAEILNRYLSVRDFDFASYAEGFSRACIEVFENI